MCLGKLCGRVIREYVEYGSFEKTITKMDISNIPYSILFRIIASWFPIAVGIMDNYGSKPLPSTRYYNSLGQPWSPYITKLDPRKSHQNTIKTSSSITSSPIKPPAKHKFRLLVTCIPYPHYCRIPQQNPLSFFLSYRWISQLNPFKSALEHH